MKLRPKASMDRAGSESIRESIYNVWSKCVNGRYILYNTLTQNLVELSQRDCQESFSNNILKSKLKSLGFFVDNKCDEFDLALKLRRNFRERAALGLALTIVPSLVCNFSCSYCVSGTNHKEKYSSVAIDNAITYAQERLMSGDKLSIQWYGGEPTLFYKQMVEATEKFHHLTNQHGAKFESSLVSNGSLFSPHFRGVIEKLNLKDCQISIDWPLDGSLRKLPGLSATMTLKRILKNINHIPPEIELSLRVNVRPDFLKTFSSLIEMIKNVVLRQCEVYVHQILDSNDKTLNQESINKLQYLDFDAYHRDRYSAKLMLRGAGFAQAYLPNDFEPAMCLALSKNAVMFAPDGTMRKCLREAHGEAAKIYPNGRMNERASFYKDYEVKKHSPCSKCTYLPICYGGCVKDIFENEFDVLHRCTPWKFTLAQEMTAYLKRERR